METREATVRLIELTIQEVGRTLARRVCSNHRKYGSGTTVVGSTIVPNGDPLHCETCASIAITSFPETALEAVERDAWEMQEVMPEARPAEVIEAMRQTWALQELTPVEVQALAAYAYQQIVNG